MPVIQSLIDDLEVIGKLHKKKNDDYANNDNPFFNFDFTESILKHFNNPRDQAFVWPIANKLGRLANLLSSSSTPNNESIDDSLLDIATYVLLWKADLKRRNWNISIKPLVCNQCGNITTRFTHRLYHMGNFMSDISLCSSTCRDIYITASGHMDSYKLEPI